MPAAELAHYDGDAADVLGPASAEVHERLRSGASWQQRFAVLDEVLARVIRSRGDAGSPPTPVANAWRLLVAGGGLTPVGEVADAVGYSDRYLTLQFRRELGLTPKAAARVIRFDAARRALQREAVTGPVRLGALAARHGYYDQSHLVRDFVAFTGRSPSRWMAEELSGRRLGG